MQPFLRCEMKEREKGKEKDVTKEKRGFHTMQREMEEVKGEERIFCDAKRKRKEKERR